MAPPYGFETTATEICRRPLVQHPWQNYPVTGVTLNSLGSHFVETVASHSPALLILASRTQESVDATAAAIRKKNPDIPTRSVVVDLSSLASRGQCSGLSGTLPEEHNGKYLNDGKIASLDLVGPWARNSFDAERLWKMSEEMVGEKFSF